MKRKNSKKIEVKQKENYTKTIEDKIVKAILFGNITRKDIVNCIRIGFVKVTFDSENNRTHYDYDEGSKYDKKNLDQDVGFALSRLVKKDILGRDKKNNRYIYFVKMDKSILDKASNAYNNMVQSKKYQDFLEEETHLKAIGEIDSEILNLFAKRAEYLSSDKFIVGKYLVCQIP